MRRSSILLAVALVGCGSEGGGGGDPDAGAPGNADAALGEVGSAEVTGTLAEQEVAPRAAFYGLHPVGGYDVLVMAEDPVAFCNFAAAGTGLTVVIGFPCGQVAPGTLAIDPDVKQACGEQPHTWFLVEGFAGESNEYLAGRGEVVITSAGGGAVVTGSFDADFGDKGALEGTFTARICDAT